MISKPFDQVDLSDLLALVERGVVEGRTLEFKRDLPRTKVDTVELLRDLTALGNGQGGDLLIGIGETAGVAAEVAGVEVESTDATRQQFENALRDRTEPRLANFQLGFVPIGVGRFVLHFRVRPSLAAPHAIRNDTHWNYFARNSVGKYEMDDRPHPAVGPHPAEARVKPREGRRAFGSAHAGGLLEMGRHPGGRGAGDPAGWSALLMSRIDRAPGPGAAPYEASPRRSNAGKRRDPNVAMGGRVGVEA